VMWKSIGSLVVKMLLGVLPILRREYREVFKVPTSRKNLLRSRCFQILGVDIMLDKRLRPWLVECNIMPSYATDSPLDAQVKGRLLAQAMAIAKSKGSDGVLHALDCEEDEVTAQEAAEEQRVAHCRARIEACFRRYAPDKLKNMDTLMAKYVDQEEELVSKVERKYSFGRTDMKQAGKPRLASKSVRGAAPHTAPEPREVEKQVDNGDLMACPLAAEEMQAEEELLVDFDRIYPPDDPEEAAFLGEMQEYALEQEETKHRRMTQPLESNNGDVEGRELVLPPIGSALNQAGAKWGAPAAREGSSWQPPPMPSKAQLGAVERMVSGDRATVEVVYKDFGPTIQPRVAPDTFLSEKQERMNRKFNNSKAVAMQSFDPFG